MAYKRYNLKDNAFAILGNGISASTTTINIVDPSGFSWVKEFPNDNFIGTLVQYGIDGNPSKVEKVYVSVRSGDVLTVQRGYLGDAPQAFAKDDYIFLNVVADHIDDVHRRIDDLDDTIDDIYTEGTRRLRVYRLPGDPPLQVRIGAGTYRVGTAEGIYAGGTITVTPSSTTRVMIDANGTIQTSTGGWNEEYTRLAEIVSDASLITSIDIWRNDAVGGVLGGLGFDDTRNDPTTPNEYNDKRLKAQLKTVAAIDLDTLTSSTFAKIIGGRGWTDDSVGNAFELAFTDTEQFIRYGATTSWGDWKQVLDINNAIPLLTSGYTFAQQRTNYTSTTLPAIAIPRGGVVTVRTQTHGTSIYNRETQLQYSVDNSTWTDIITINTAMSKVDYVEVASFLMPPGYVRAISGGAQGSSSISAQIF